MELRIALSPRGILALYAFPETPVFSLRLLVDEGPRRVFVTPHCRITREQLEAFEQGERWRRKWEAAPSLESGPIRLQLAEFRGYGSQVTVSLERKLLGMVATEEVVAAVREVLRAKAKNIYDSENVNLA